MSSHIVPFSLDQIEEFTIESKSMWSEFSRFVDDDDTPDNLRRYMRALFPYIEERWQIYQYKRNTLIRKYVELFDLRRNILAEAPEKTRERAEQVVRIAQAIIQQSAVMSKKINDQSNRYIDCVECDTCFRSDEYGFYAFGKEGAPTIKAMMPFLTFMVNLTENEQALLKKLGASAAKIIRVVDLVYLRSRVKKEEVLTV